MRASFHGILAAAMLLASACYSEPPPPPRAICGYDDYRVGERAVYRLDEGGAEWLVTVEVTRKTDWRTFFRIEEMPIGGLAGSGVVTEFDERERDQFFCTRGEGRSQRQRLVLGIYNSWGEIDAQEYGEETCQRASRDTGAGAFNVNRCESTIQTRTGSDAMIEEYAFRGAKVPGNGLVAKTVRPGGANEWTAVIESWNGR